MSTTPFNPLVSFFPNAYENLPERDIPAADFVADIRSGKYRHKVGIVRERFQKALARGIPYAKAKGFVEKQKKALAAVTLSGVCPGRQKELAIKHTGLMQADLDLLGDRKTEIRQGLMEDPHVFALFESCTGEGLKAVYRVPVCNGEDQQQQAFRAVANRVEDLVGIAIDELTDITRLCFTSNDPAAYTNLQAVELSVAFQAHPPEPDSKPTTSTGTTANSSDRARVAHEVLGSIRWENSATGFCDCPGKARHTNGDAEKDCKVWLDGVPSIQCMH
jgi:hypothetical protein